MKITFAQALNKALHDELEADPSTLLFGLGVADVKGVFGTTTGLQSKFGRERVFDIPLSENAITGAALGMSFLKLKPILVHQRADFVFTSAEQIINQIAKTYFTSGGKFNVPLVIRMIVGRGWGQGPTHAQSPHALFATVPGLKIVLPATPEDAYEMLRGSIQDPDPVLFIEHRWLYQNETNISNLNMSNKHTGCSVLAKGDDLTFVGISLGAMEGIKIAKVFDFFGIKVNVINLRSVVPLDISTIVKSVEITKKLVILDIAQTKFGVAETISENVMRQLWNKLDNTPLVLGLKNIPVPSSPTLAKQVYPSTLHSTLRINEEFNLGVNSESLRNKFVEMWPVTSEYEDQPDLGLVGPF
jgi:pyruvate dehydrogenase E1 component beta subunit